VNDPAAIFAGNVGEFQENPHPAAKPASTKQL
jgi:hypothetical protein